MPSSSSRSGCNSGCGGSASARRRYTAADSGAPLRVAARAASTRRSTTHASPAGSLTSRCSATSSFAARLRGEQLGRAAMALGALAARQLACRSPCARSGGRRRAGARARGCSPRRARRRPPRPRPRPGRPVAQPGSAPRAPARRLPGPAALQARAGGRAAAAASGRSCARRCARRVARTPHRARCPPRRGRPPERAAGTAFPRVARRQVSVNGGSGGRPNAASTKCSTAARVSGARRTTSAEASVVIVASRSAPAPLSRGRLATTSATLSSSSRVSRKAR